MKFRIFDRFHWSLLVVIFVVVIGAAWFLLRADLGPGDIRAVILISIDTCRADYLSCYGYHRKTTPNIDAVAAEAVLFENVISPVPITLPSHSSMLTGTIPPYHGVHDNYYRLGQASETLAEILHQNGFQTAAIIGAFVMDTQFGLNQGFNSYNDRFDEKLIGSLIAERKAEEVSRYGVKWLQQHHREPFFLFLHYFDPHYPYAPPEPFASDFSYNTYAGEIAYTDQCIGRVIKELKELRLYDSTLIIITSDHGEMLGDHGEYTHAYFIYQSAIKVPLIVKLPGQRKSKKIKELVGLIDIVPTVCSLLGIKPPAQVHGQDLSSALLGQNLPDQQRHLYCESLYPTKYNANSLLGVVTNRFKYIQTTHPELYDLTQDQHENNNLINQWPQQGRILQDRLKQILEQTLRKDTSGSKVELDEQSRKRLESLGYVSGSVNEDFEFDQSKDDPKDLIVFHLAEVEVWGLLSKKKYDEAKSLCYKMLSERPDFEGTYAHLGTIAKKQGDKDKAFSYMTEALKLNPDGVRIRNEFGTMLAEQGKTEEAIKHFTESLRIRPDQFDAHRKLGSLLQSKGKLDEAISHYRQALQLKPDDAKMHSNLGGLLASQAKLGEAITHFTEAVKLNPNSANAHYILARALKDSDRTNEAITEYKETLRLRPDWVIPMNSLAWILATHKDDKIRYPGEAIQLAERACELTNYKNVGFMDTLAAAYAAAGRFSDAVTAAEKAVELATATGNKERARSIQNRLQMYKNGQPYCEPLPSQNNTIP